MRRSKPQVRRGQKHKSPPALVLSRSREASKANSPPLPPDFVFLANAHDQFAVTKLRSAVGELAVDVLIRNHRQLIRQLAAFPLPFPGVDVASFVLWVLRVGAYVAR
jgi:hypothetical protein